MMSGITKWEQEETIQIWDLGYPKLKDYGEEMVRAERGKAGGVGENPHSMILWVKKVFKEETEQILNATKVSWEWRLTQPVDGSKTVIGDLDKSKLSW